MNTTDPVSHDADRAAQQPALPEAAARPFPESTLPPGWPDESNRPQEGARFGATSSGAAQPGPSPFDAPPKEQRRTGRAPSYSSAKTLSTVALVLGIVGLFLNPLGGPSVAALVCGILAKSQIDELRRRGEAAPSDGSAIAGIVLGGIGLAGTVVFKGGVF